MGSAAAARVFSSVAGINNNYLYRITFVFSKVRKGGKKPNNAN
jgi:hypothetical protein